MELRKWPILAPEEFPPIPMPMPIKTFLVHHPDQTNRCRAMKFGMCLPIDTGYGGFQGKFRKFIFYPKKCVFGVFWDLEEFWRLDKTLVQHPD